jgi:NADH dehydrogenase [ubiquinone] 1 alpha subcomplex assembly factor 7
MSDALRALRVAPDFGKDLEVHLVETSPTLRAQQQEVLASFEIAWTARFDPWGFDGPLFLVANEFFDALPIRQFVKSERGSWHVRVVVTAANGELAFALSPLDASTLVPAKRRDAPPGSVFETAPAASALIEEIARHIALRGGAALLIDYGYDEPATHETLQAVAGHKFASILEAPGEADLSAHVDFAALADAARAAGAEVHGPVAQGDFLTGLGIKERASQLKEKDQAVDDAVDRLVGADRMGTLFKAFAVLPMGEPRPPGF